MERLNATGTSRSQRWTGLSSQQEIKTVVRAELKVDGQLVRESREISIHAGRVSKVDFDLKVQETSLTVHAPADATVYLVGSIHALKASLYPLPAPIEDAFAVSDTIVVETDVINADPNELRSAARRHSLLPPGEEPLTV